MRAGSPLLARWHAVLAWPLRAPSRGARGDVAGSLHVQEQRFDGWSSARTFFRMYGPLLEVRFGVEKPRHLAEH